MALLLLDTCVYVALSKGDTRAKVALESAEAAYLNVVGLGEILAGFPEGSQWEDDILALDSFIEDAITEILPLSADTAQLYGSLYNHVKQRGRLMPTNDLWIAASALEHDLTILTADRHFAELPVSCALLE